MVQSEGLWRGGLLRLLLPLLLPLAVPLLPHPLLGPGKDLPGRQTLDRRNQAGSCPQWRRVGLQQRAAVAAAAAAVADAAAELGAAARPPPQTAPPAGLPLLQHRLPAHPRPYRPSARVQGACAETQLRCCQLHSTKHWQQRLLQRLLQRLQRQKMRRWTRRRAGRERQDAADSLPKAADPWWDGWLQPC